MTSIFIANTIIYAPFRVAAVRHLSAMCEIMHFSLGKPILNLLGFLRERVACPQALAEKERSWGRPMTEAPQQGGGEPVTDYQMRQDNVRLLCLDIHNLVSLISSLLIIAIVPLALANQETTAELFGWLRPMLTSEFDWFLVLCVDVILLFSLVLIVLPIGAVRTGGKNAKPDYSYSCWIAMKFTAGIGIGLLFFGVLEPTYYNFSEGGNANPLNIGISQPGNEYAGVVETIHHWGLGGWWAYALVGLTLAVFAYNKSLPMTLRSAFYPILGERIWGWWSA